MSDPPARVLRLAIALRLGAIAAEAAEGAESEAEPADSIRGRASAQVAAIRDRFRVRQIPITKTMR